IEGAINGRLKTAADDGIGSALGHQNAGRLVAGGGAGLVDADQISVQCVLNRSRTTDFNAKLPVANDDISFAAPGTTNAIFGCAFSHTDPRIGIVGDDIGFNHIAGRSSAADYHAVPA